ncbi:unnamed protein product [Pieris macdunnoughi]|uniref:Uncharacterized protein n=1 Tax=Pieris macdunnoughi TaxID=345717 RepID=A0A821VRW7_9NEOP|nr:unnamed protein product [Pieris macdunnoughi]
MADNLRVEPSSAESITYRGTRSPRRHFIDRFHCDISSVKGRRIQYLALLKQNTTIRVVGSVKRILPSD